MSWMYGTDYDYANTRLAGTLVRHGATPVIVVGIHGDGQATVRNLDGGGDFIIQANELDCTPVPLGYVNVPGGCLYVSRMPARRWRQGLSDVTTNAVRNGGGDVRPPPWNLIKHCILNEYPPIRECRLVDEARAWHRHWSSTNTKLFYKGECVGGFGRDGKPVLQAKFRYLQEALNDDLD